MRCASSACAASSTASTPCSAITAWNCCWSHGTPGGSGTTASNTVLAGCSPPIQGTIAEPGGRFGPAGGQPRRVPHRSRTGEGGQPVNKEIESELHEYVQSRYTHLRRTAFLLCGEWHRAEDLVQTALAKVVVAARRGRVESLDAYSRQVLLRVYLDDNQRGSRRRERNWADPAGAAEPPVVAGDQATALTVLAALRTLPARQRATIVLRYWEDRSVEDTAAVLGVSEGTVKSQSAKGLAALRQLLAGSLAELMFSDGGVV
jgi:RNA polymerase sigma-70 factor (sigma-E family)